MYKVQYKDWEITLSKNVLLHPILGRIAIARRTIKGTIQMLNGEGLSDEEALSKVRTKIDAQVL